MPLVNEDPKAPRKTTYSVGALYKHQREAVWSESKQIGLIDSIFRNFYIPPVVLAVNANDDGTDVRTCIDGKERLTSIHRFVEGLIPYTDSHTGEDFWYCDNFQHGMRHGMSTAKLLSEEHRSLFDEKVVVCVEYQDLGDASITELRSRL
ncbi:hypothetical protein C8R46DRAFT_1359800 [Mycena filopes]|nr:hypothetical protein C8R46DRAFT_1359800 [Mycena filopes]